MEIRPDWPDVLPLATVAVTIAGVVAGMLWTMSRLFRPMAVEVAREACDRLKADLESNHFHDISERLDRMQAGFDERFDGMQAGFDERFDGVQAGFDARFDRMRAGFDARLDRMRAGFGERLNRLDGRINERLDRMDLRDEERTARILEAVRSQGHAGEENLDG